MSLTEKVPVTKHKDKTRRFIDVHITLRQHRRPSDKWGWGGRTGVWECTTKPKVGLSFRKETDNLQSCLFKSLARELWTLSSSEYKLHFTCLMSTQAKLPRAPFYEAKIKILAQLRDLRDFSNVFFPN